MRSLALLLLCLALTATGAHADVIRIAVVGFDSDVAPDTMKALSSAMRTAMASAVERGTFEVVSRDEMSAAYFKRGGACPSSDTACVVDASGAWGGRLFVRGKTTAAPNGIVVDVTLESVRGVLVATATGVASDAAGIPALAPQLAKQLVDGERAFRTHKRAGPVAAALATAKVANPPPPDPCKGAAVLGTAFVDGSLVDDDKGIHFRAATPAPDPAPAVTWAALKELRPTDYAKRPALHVLSSSPKDAVLVTFADAAARDACFGVLKARADALKKKPAPPPTK